MKWLDFYRVSLLHITFSFCSVALFAQDDDYQEERLKMVELQIEARGIFNPSVLKAMREVPRHLFIPSELSHFAYADSPLGIGEGQTISQPYVVAFMTEVLQLEHSDRVLEIGTGSGYQAAVLSRMCDSVFTIELFESLAHKANAVFTRLGYRNIVSKTGDGYQGWPQKAPFDAIIVTCSPTHIPAALQSQLAEGGRMIIPVGVQGAQNLVLLKKVNGKITKKHVLPVRFVPMLDQNGSVY